MAKRESKQAKSERAQQHQRMLEEAKNRPGIREDMNVHHSWRRYERELAEAHRINEMGKRSILTTSDRSDRLKTSPSSN